MNIKKKNKIIKILTNIFIVLIIGIIIFFSISSNKKIILTDEEKIKCIGEKATLFVQLGCIHCKTQEDLFGENLKYIEVIDCFYETDKCEKVKATPSWKIGNKYITGVQSIEKLGELTGC